MYDILFRHNKIGEKGAEHIAAALSNLKGLKRLNISLEYQAV